MTHGEAFGPGVRDCNQSAEEIVGWLKEIVNDECTIGQSENSKK